MFAIVLLIYLAAKRYKRKILILLLIPQLYVALMGGSRTYLVLILVETVIFYYVWLKNKKMFILSAIPIVIILGWLLFNSSTMQKIIISVSEFGSGNSKEAWRRLSNSRNIIWAERIDAYKQFSLVRKVFGGGINYTTDRFGLWSHSDFVEILCSFGLVGIINYAVIMWKTICTLLSKNMPIWMRIAVIFIWLFNAGMNFFYCYLNAVLCYPFLLVALSDTNWNIYRRKRLPRQKSVGEKHCGLPLKGA